MYLSRTARADPAAKAADHAVIAATAAVRQARTPTARAAAALDRPRAGAGPAAALVDLLRARGTAANGGSFHPDVARRR